MEKWHIIALISISIIVLAVVIYMVFFRKKRTFTLKGDTNDYGSKEIISDTLSRRNPSSLLFKTSSLSTTSTTPTPSSNFPPITPDDSWQGDFSDPTQKALKEIKENIRKATGKDFYLCGKNRDYTVMIIPPRIQYFENWFVMIGLAIQSLLTNVSITPSPTTSPVATIPLYDIGSFLIPVTQMKFSYPDSFKGIQMTYEEDNKTVKSVRVMKVKMKINEDNTGTQLDSTDPYTVSEFVYQSAMSTRMGPFLTQSDILALIKPDSSGKITMDDNVQKIIDWKWGERYSIKSKLCTLIEEKILIPFSKNLFDGKLSDQGYDIDVTTFTKCLLSMFMQRLNHSMVKYENNCCQDDYVKEKCDNILSKESNGVNF